jgi:hypothetical protein
VRQITEVISTKRSAHRAFSRWFCHNSRRPLAFFNNVSPSGPPRLRELERYREGVPYVASGDADHVNELLEGDTDVLMNFVGKIPSSVERWNDKYLRSHVNGRLVRVVFLRDPVNTLASLAKRCRPKDFRSLFKYFYQVLALEQIIGQLAKKKSSFCEKVVLMSPWLSDEHYRAEVAGFFDLSPGAPPPEVTRQGGGSSFNGMAYDSGTNPSLHERWRVMEDNPLFLTLFADPETTDSVRSYFRIFGAHESLDPATVDSLEQRAAKDDQAADYLKRLLAPMRRARASLDAMEFAPQPAIRELWKGVVTTRMMLRI